MEHKVVFSLCLVLTVVNADLKQHCHDAEPHYPILMDHCGPEPQPAPPACEPPIVLPTHHEPMKVLPHPPIPEPKVLSHHVVHYQTVLKPQVFQRVITVPRLVRFMRKSIKPVIEHIPYHAKPIGLAPPEMCHPSPLELRKQRLSKFLSALKGCHS